jgi:hypothetical protein
MRQQDRTFPTKPGITCRLLCFNFKCACNRENGHVEESHHGHVIEHSTPRG